MLPSEVFIPLSVRKPIRTSSATEEFFGILPPVGRFTRALASPHSRARHAGDRERQKKMKELTYEPFFRSLLVYESISERSRCNDCSLRLKCGRIFVSRTYSEAEIPTNPSNHVATGGFRLSKQTLLSSYFIPRIESKYCLFCCEKFGSRGFAIEFREGKLKFTVFASSRFLLR